jgi:cytochrome c oxidase assembly protein subunit 15
MTSTYHPGGKFALFVFCWTILLLVAGALVTSNDAALVPDWPTSYGTFTPPMYGGILHEHSHRLVAGALGIFRSSKPS